MNSEISNHTSTREQSLQQPNVLESLTVLHNDVIACNEGTMCEHSPYHSLQPKCRDCRLSPNNKLLGLTKHYWKSINRNWRHNILEKEKQDAKREKTIAKRKAEKAKDPTKQARLRAAARAERKTNATIIKSTRNSGRINRDGDHLLGDNIILDTKLQSTTSNPIVHLHELEKVRSDAKRNGRQIGVLCIKNKTGRGICVLDERDFATLIKR